MQEITLVLRCVHALEQFATSGRAVPADARVVPGRDLFGAQPHGVVQKCLELDFGVAQHVRVRCPAGLVFAQELREHAVLVFGREVDVFDLDTDHIRDRRGIHEIDVRCAVFGIVVIIPVLHEDADDLMPLLLQQVRRHRGVDSPAQTHDDPLLAHRATLSRGTADVGMQHVDRLPSPGKVLPDQGLQAQQTNVSFGQD